MKKLLLVTLLVLALIITVACTQTQEPQGTSSDTTSSADITDAPTEEVTSAPDEDPTDIPTEAPTAEPTEAPTEEPTEEPTAAPTEEPTDTPTEPVTEPVTEPEKPRENIALGKPITSASVQNENTRPGNANDGNHDTLFVAAPFGTFDLILDLEGIYALSDMRIEFENSNWPYTVSVSENGVDYTEVLADGPHGGADKEITLDGIHARFVKFTRLPDDGATHYWFCIYELYVYGEKIADIGPEKPRENIALGKPIHSDSYQNENTLPGNANDGSYDTLFVAAPFGTFDLILDLQGIYALSDMKVAFENSNWQYTISVSENGVDYTEVLADGPHGGADKIISLNGVHARFIKLTRLPDDGATHRWFCIYEMFVYGEKVADIQPEDTEDPTETETSEPETNEPETNEPETNEPETNEPEQPAENIALGKPIHSDSYQNENTLPANANDGSYDTLFVAAPFGTFDLILDLENVYTLSSMKIAFENSNWQYTVSVSENGVDYTEVLADGPHGGADKEIALNGVNARYIKLTRLPDDGATHRWFCIYELFVYGK